MGAVLVRLSQGFTLIEVLIVVAIIIVLAAMLMPVFEVATKRAEATSCLMNVRHIGMAAALYTEDNDDRLLPARVCGAPPGYTGIGWGLTVQPYLRNEAILVCPSDPNPTVAAGIYGLKRSYGINYELTLVGGYNNSSLKLGDISKETQTIMFFDIRSPLRRLGISYPYDGTAALGARHREGANFVFVDGHAKWYRAEQTTTPQNLWSP